MVYIYILKLQKGKYYVGKTNNIQLRLHKHFNSNGSKWTQIYKPIKILEIIPDCDDYDEDKFTIKYMEKYGIHNVRGGSYVSVKLCQYQIDCLNQSIKGVSNKCFACGKKGHFAKDCKLYEFFETDSDEGETDSDEGESKEFWYCDFCNKEFNTIKACAFHENVQCEIKHGSQMNLHITNDFTRIGGSSRYGNSCFRCGRKGHFASSCYASKHIKGFYLNQ